MKRNNECTGKIGECQPRHTAAMLGRERTRRAGMPSNGDTCTEWFMQPLAEAFSGTGSPRLGLPLQLRHIASLSAHHSQSYAYEFLAVEPISARLQQFSTSAISTPQSLPSTSSARPVAGLTSQVASRGEPVAVCHAHPLGSAGSAVGLAMQPDLIRPLETSRRQLLREGDMSEIVSHPSHCAFGLDELSRCNLFLTFFSDPPCLLFSVFCSTSCSLFSSQLQSNCHKHSLISWRIHDLSPMIIRV
jgi:hypothetical protein